jgi:ComF family protein
VRAVDAARAVGPHEGVLREAVHALKYHGLVSVAAPMAVRMRDAGRDVLRGADAVIPVPLYPAREWRRGFNQAELLGRHIGLPVVHALCRVRATVPQTGLSSRERRVNVRAAFALAAFPGARGAARWINVLRRWDTRRTAAWISDRVLVLVDDVSTTGATLDACARTLKAAGAREVRAVTAARAGPAPR